MSCPVIVSVDDVGVLNQFNGSAIAVFRSRGALRSTQNQRHSRESGNPTPSAALRGNVARRVPAFAGMTEKKVPRGASVLRLRRLAFLGGAADDIVDPRAPPPSSRAPPVHTTLQGPRGPVHGRANPR